MIWLIDNRWEGLLSHNRGNNMNRIQYNRQQSGPSLAQAIRCFLQSDKPTCHGKMLEGVLSGEEEILSGR